VKVFPDCEPVSGTWHHLEWLGDLTTNTWACCVSNQAFSAGTRQITNTVGAGVTQRFYRVKASY